MNCSACHKSIEGKAKITRFWRDKIYRLCSESCAHIHMYVIMEVIFKEQTKIIGQ